MLTWLSHYYLQVLYICQVSTAWQHRNIAQRREQSQDLLEGKSALLEWSFAQSCDFEKEPTGEEYLVFYEARTV